MARIYILVFLSGFTGLFFQVVWQKYLSAVLGSHASATAIVLSLFFLFLACGYAFWGKFSDRFLKNRIYQYAVFELVIGLYALYSPQYFEFLFKAFSQQSVQAGSLAWDGILFSTLFMFLPTFLMGGTIPVLTQGLSKTYAQSSKTHAFIYSCNSFGAFVGCLFAGFYAIEAWGLSTALFYAGDLNIIIALLAWYWGRDAVIEDAPAQVAGPDKKSAMPIKEFACIGAISFLSGAYTFIAENILIRMAGLSIGSTTYTYSIIVGAFILAIAVGGFCVYLFNEKVKGEWLPLQLGLTFLCFLATYFLIQKWPVIFFVVKNIFLPSEMTFRLYWFTVLAVILALLIVPVGLMGMNLPYLFKVLRNEKESLAGTVGKLYGLNCLGAALGALAGGIWLYKFFDAAEIFKAILMLVVVGFLCSLIFVPSRKLKGIYFGVAGLFMAIVFALPNWQHEKFVPGLHTIGLSKDLKTTLTQRDEFRDQLIFSEYDANTLGSVGRHKNHSVLYVNGKPDASTNGDFLTRALAVINPISISGEPIKKVFIAGLGAGLSTAVVSHYDEVESVRVVEISESVVKALPYFESFNFNLKDRMHKVHLEVGDAYRALLSSREKYDLIVCEPSSPWVTGVDKLFSKEFYQVGLDRLNENGLYAQWFPLGYMDAETFRIILATFASVFPYATIFEAGRDGAITLIGSRHAPVPNVERLQKLFQQNKAIYDELKISSPEAPVLGQMLNNLQLRALIYKKNDFNSVFGPILEYRAGRAYFTNQRLEIYDLLIGAIPVPLPETLKPDPWLSDAIAEGVTANAVDKFIGVTKSPVDFHEMRIALNFNSLLKGSQRRLAQEAGLYLLGKNDKFVEGIDLTLKRVESLSAYFRTLIAIGERPNLSQLVRPVEKKCPTDPKFCWSARLAVVKALGRVEAQRNLSRILGTDLTDSEKNLIKDNYEQLFKDYKQLGRF
jgi:spermidine synthase